MPSKTITMHGNECYKFLNTKIFPRKNFFGARPMASIFACGIASAACFHGRNKFVGSFSQWQLGVTKQSIFACGIAPAACFRMRRCSSQIVRFFKEFFERNQSLTRMPTSNTFCSQGSPGPHPQASLSNARWLRHMTTEASILHAESPQLPVFTVGANPLKASLSGNWGFAKQSIFCMRNRLSGLFSR